MPYVRQRILEPSSSQVEGTYVRLGLKVFGAIVLLVGLIWGGRVAFLRLQERRLIQQAQVSLDKGDKRWATIAARRVFELEPENPDACRLLARIAEGEGSTAAVEWRQHVMLARPDSVDDAIELARVAVRFSRSEIAERALEKIAPKAHGHADYYEVRGQLALAKKEVRAAATDFARALELEPTNRSYELNLALAQLQSDIAAERAEATKQLRVLLGDKQVRVLAARALRDNALRHRDASALLETSGLLASYPDAELVDRIIHVQLLHQMQHREFDARLAKLQEEAEGSPRALFEVMTWMSRDGLALVALDWAKRIPSGKAKQIPAAVAVATCYAAAKDWAGLQEWCKDANWGSFEFLRRAISARALREADQALDSRIEWGEALKEVGSDANKVLALQQEVAQWGWTAEAADLLWTLAKDKTQQNAALAALYKFYSERGLTSDVYRVVMRLMELRPDDAAVMNNFAQLSLLLNMNTSRAQQIAEQLHARDPRNAAYGSTYAYSLFVSGNLPEALNVMNGLAPEDLQSPAIAGYYGILLAAAGEKDSAKNYLELGAHASLLPEEKVALDRAVRTIR